MTINIGMHVWVDDPDDPLKDGFDHAFQGCVVGVKNGETLFTVTDQDGNTFDVPKNKVQVDPHIRRDCDKEQKDEQPNV